MSAVDWFAEDWGGRVHTADNGSDVPDRHTTPEDNAERNH